MLNCQNDVSSNRMSNTGKREPLRELFCCKYFVVRQPHLTVDASCHTVAASSNLAAVGKTDAVFLSCRKNGVRITHVESKVSAGHLDRNLVRAGIGRQRR